MPVMAERKYQFERLTPTDNVDLDVYEDAINYIFENPDVKNIAISGAYSAGKSSVLASYKKKYGDIRFLHISLAHFKSPEQEEETEVKESILEGKILNQLIHQIPSDKIPQTNFRVKKKVDSKNIIKSTLIIVVAIISTLYLALFDLWAGYVSALPNNWLKSLLALTTNLYALLISGIVLTLELGYLVYGLIKIQKNKNVFRKLSLQGNEIEIFEESDDSYFDKYLNEVLYLFENAEADVIVFEDMDRFNANRIFERLREVNILVNIKHQKEERKPLRFFYLLRDDIFISKDRIKFFDYIIPVVPVVDSSNSYDQFIAHFKRCGLFEKFEESFLQGLSLYIDDMRLLKNIYNEFVIYYSRLNTIELDYNKMLAIIAYKNLFPRDFINLQLNQGFVYTLFSKKDEFIQAEIIAIQKKIKEKESIITSSKSGHLISIRELNAAFADKYLRNYNWDRYEDDELSNFICRSLNGSRLEEYLSRRQILDNLRTGNLSKLNEEISNLEQESLLVKNKQLHEMITRDNIIDIFSITSKNEIGHETSFNEIKGSEYFDLLKYLIRNGYIDETYSDYMTYFYENSLSRIDKAFLRSITDKKAKDYTYKLKNPQLVVSRLKLTDFDQVEVLNFDLLTYLLQSLSPIEYLERYINQLKETKNFKFIGAYFNITTELPAYIKHLNSQWSEIFMIVLNTNALSDKQIRNYSISSIYYSSDDVIQAMNQDNCLSCYIANSPDYLAINEPNIERLIHGFKLLEVRFPKLEYRNSNLELFRAVYQNTLYEINFDNLKLMLQQIYGIENENAISHKNYTQILTQPYSPLAQYIDENISEYLDVILLASNGTISDDEDAALSILNNKDVTIEQKHAYIEALRIAIVSIKMVNDISLWKPLLNNSIAMCSEENIMEYFCAIKSLDKIIIDFINSCRTVLDFSEVLSAYGDEKAEELFDAVTICNSLENQKYKQILVSLGFTYEDFDVPNITDEKLVILIDENIIKMNPKTLDFIRKNYGIQVFYFIQKHLGEYTEMMTTDLFSAEELMEILSWNIADEIKIGLLKFTDEAISVIGKNYTPAVCLYILDNNFMEENLIALCSSFDDWNDSVQNIIFNLSIKYITDIIDSPKDVSENLKQKLIHSDNLSIDTKIELFIAMLPTLNEELIKDNLSLLGLTSYLKLFDSRSRPKFEINTTNKSLLAAFKENNWIYDYEENPDKDGYYKIIRKKASTPLPDELL